MPCERGYGGFGFVGEEAEEAERGWERSIRRELDGFLELKGVWLVVLSGSVPLT